MMSGAAGERGRAGHLSDSLHQSLEDRLREFIEAKGPAQLNVASRLLFEHADGRAVTALKAEKHNGVALRAAWEEVVRATRPRTDEPGRVKRREDVVAIHRFVGFAEGRLRITLVPWWERAMLHGYKAIVQGYTDLGAGNLFSVARYFPQHETTLVGPYWYFGRETRARAGD